MSARALWRTSKRRTTDSGRAPECPWGSTATGYAMDEGTDPRRYRQRLTRKSMETTTWSRRTMLAAALALTLPNRAGADLVGHEEIRAAVAGKTDDVLIARNPLLARLARDDPALLREVLQRLRVPAPSHRRSLAMGQPEPATATESAVLAENPDLRNSIANPLKRRSTCCASSAKRRGGNSPGRNTPGLRFPVAGRRSRQRLSRRNLAKRVRLRG